MHAIRHELKVSIDPDRYPNILHCKFSGSVSTEWLICRPDAFASVARILCAQDEDIMSVTLTRLMQKKEIPTYNGEQTQVWDTLPLKPVCLLGCLLLVLGDSWVPLECRQGAS